MRYQLSISPRDVLFFRDARPMEGSFMGGGGNWPFPSTWHSAMLSAFYREWPERQEEWEKEHRHKKAKNDNKFGYSSLRFGGLKTWGPFPERGNEIYFPVPLDVTRNEKNQDKITVHPRKVNFGNNAPLPYLAVNQGKPSKNSPGSWISAKNLEAYLENRSFSTVENAVFFDNEQRPGIRINPENGTAEKHIFFSSEYLRLREGTSMSVFTECLSRGEGNREYDLAGKLLEGKKTLPIIFGGQQGVAFMAQKRKDPAFFNDYDYQSGKYLKWVLLSPAVFVKNGWAPGWVENHNGSWKVRLKVPVERKKGESRNLWRARVREAAHINAELVAAIIGKPRHFSGWRNLTRETDEKKSGPGRTYLAVPAGSVFYFKCGSAEDAQHLAQHLHGKVKSDILGEQGFGLGICGKWNENNEGEDK